MVDAEVEVTREIIGDISPQIFGGLLEHMGRCIYGGVWDLQSQRPRRDVIGAMKALAPTALRWPGGCFSAWYRWLDGVGPRETRPTRARQFWTDNSAHGPRLRGATNSTSRLRSDRPRPTRSVPTSSCGIAWTSEPSRSWS